MKPKVARRAGILGSYRNWGLDPRNISKRSYRSMRLGPSFVFSWWWESLSEHVYRHFATHLFFKRRVGGKGLLRKGSNLGNGSRSTFVCHHLGHVFRHLVVIGTMPKQTTLLTNANKEIDTTGTPNSWSCKRQK